MTSTLLRALAVCLALTLAASCGAPAPDAEPRTDPALDAASRTRGAELYGMHCAVCHGPEGRGDGPAAAFLQPAARDFGTGAFRLVSTDRRVPAQRDLVATLQRGMPGSAMPAWGWLEDEDLEVLATHVRRLAVEGLAADAIAAGAEPEEARENAERRMDPGAMLPLIEPVSVNAESLARGEAVYARNCAACHGRTGSGTEAVPEARDFTAGFLRGGAAHDELAWRIRCGLPGTVMPALDLESDELADLVNYVQSLIPGGSTSRYVLDRQDLSVRRVAFPVPTDPEDSRWRDAMEIDVRLAPLRWRSESIFVARLAALHDGSSIAIRLRWADDTRESQLLGDLLATDAAALQLSSQPRPPLFGMGSPDHPTNLWHWKSARIGDVAGALDLVEGGPHRAVDPVYGEVVLDGPVYRPFEGVPPVAVRGDEKTAQGVENARGAESRSGGLSVHPTSTADGWDVIFVRSLAAPTEQDFAFRGPEPVQVSVAIWNGAAGDQGAQKSISIWQELRLLP